MFSPSLHITTMSPNTLDATIVVMLISCHATAERQMHNIHLNMCVRVFTHNMCRYADMLYAHACALYMHLNYD